MKEEFILNDKEWVIEIKDKNLIKDFNKNKFVFNIPKYAKNKKIEKICILLSGGADSAILLYFILNYMKNFNENYTILPVTFYIKEKKYQEKHTKQILDFMKDKFPEYKNNILPRSLIFLSSDDFNTKRKEFLNLYYRMGYYDLRMTGITKYPDEKYRNTWGYVPNFDNRVNGREPYFINQDVPTYLPFFEWDKRITHEIYSEFGVLDDLFPITRSCEQIIDPDLWNGHCGKCWWCKERFWAFKRL